MFWKGLGEFEKNCGGWTLIEGELQVEQDADQDTE